MAHIKHLMPQTYYKRTIASTAAPQKYSNLTANIHLQQTATQTTFTCVDELNFSQKSHMKYIETTNLSRQATVSRKAPTHGT